MWTHIPPRASIPNGGFDALSKKYRSKMSKEIVSYYTGESPLGRLLVATTDRGVLYVNAGKDDIKLLNRMRKELHGVTPVKDGKARPLLHEVSRYLAGQKVDLPLDLRGTAFQLHVWAALQRIPFGETRSYSEVAQMVGRPKAVRAVANACATNPVPFIVPCHRVVRKDGSLGGYGGGLPMKRTLLSNESVDVARNPAS